MRISVFTNFYLGVLFAWSKTTKRSRLTKNHQAPQPPRGKMKARWGGACEFIWFRFTTRDIFPFALLNRSAHLTIFSRPDAAMIELWICIPNPISRQYLVAAQTIDIVVDSRKDRPSKKEIMSKAKERGNRKNVYRVKRQYPFTKNFPTILSFFRGKVGERFLFSTALIFCFFSIKRKEEGIKISEDRNSGAIVWTMIPVINWGLWFPERMS